MSRGWSITRRLAVTLSLLALVLWLGVVAISGMILRGEINSAFDTTMEEMARRILPLATHAAEESMHEDDNARAVRELTSEGSNFTYNILDPRGRVVLFTGSRVFISDLKPVPAGFSRIDGAPAYALYDRETRFGIVVRENSDLRSHLVQENVLRLILPMALLVPLMAAAIIWIARRSMDPLRAFGAALGQRGGRNLSLFEAEGHPAELLPIIEETNKLFRRLQSALDAERAFAAESAHELRTPVAGALAQLQLAATKIEDPETLGHLDQSVAAMKRLARLAENLLQTSRLDAGFAASSETVHLNPIASMVLRDFGAADIRLDGTPCHAFMSPDAFSIVLRNLVENALRYRTADTPVAVTLAAGSLTVENDCAALEGDDMDRLKTRFQRNGRTGHGGVGLGLAIVDGIARSAGGSLELASPRPGQTRGFCAVVRFGDGSGPEV